MRGRREVGSIARLKVHAKRPELTKVMLTIEMNSINMRGRVSGLGGWVIRCGK